MDYTVKRLYCKRPIQCLASSKKLTPPPPHRPANVSPPAFDAGGGHIRWVEMGVGGQYLDFGRRQTQLCTVLYICFYLVDYTICKNFYYLLHFAFCLIVPIENLLNVFSLLSVQMPEIRIPSYPDFFSIIRSSNNIYKKEFVIKTGLFL